MVMGNMDRVQLRLNGRLLGEQKIDPFRMNFFEVPYEAGRLEAVGFSDKKGEVARTAVETTGPAVALQLLPDRESLQGDGRDAMPITLRAVDAQGRPVPLDASLVNISVSGAGQSIGHGNGDPNSHEDEKGPTRRLFNGLAQLIVQSRADGQNLATDGEVLVSVSAEGLAPASVRLPVRRVAALGAVPVEGVPLTLLRDWRISPTSAMRPDPNVPMADNDMNTWAWGMAPTLEKLGLGQVWRQYRSSFTPRRNLADGSASLHFARVQGRAEVWLDGQLLGRKTSAEAGPLRVSVPAGGGKRLLSVLVEAPCSDCGETVGISGPVSLE